MKSIIYMAIISIVIFGRGCEREVWEKDRDLTAILEQNENIEESKAYNDFASAPIRIRFKDGDDGFFYFSDDDREIPFKFYEEGNNIYRVLIDESEQKTIELRKTSEKQVIVRFAWGSTWVVYIKE